VLSYKYSSQAFSDLNFLFFFYYFYFFHFFLAFFLHFFFRDSYLLNAIAVLLYNISIYVYVRACLHPHKQLHCNIPKQFYHFILNILISSFRDALDLALPTKYYRGNFFNDNLIFRACLQKHLLTFTVLNIAGTIMEVFLGVIPGSTSDSMFHEFSLNAFKS
jgi:hypothetical protein